MPILQITKVCISCSDAVQILSKLGKTRFDRLYLIGTSSIPLSSEALRAAIVEAKQGKDVKLYDSAVSALHDIFPTDHNYITDLGWMDKTNKQVKAESDRLELELKGYKNNLIKESIRVGCAGPQMNHSLLTLFKDGIR